MGKKYRPFTILIVFMLAVCGCGPRNSNSPSGNNDTSVPDDGFLTVYKKFTEAVRHKSFDELKTILDPAAGIFIIQSEGAMPAVYNLPDISAFVAQNGKTLFDFFSDKISLDPVSEELPAVDCKYSNGTPYSKAGCYMKKISSSDNELNYLSSANGNADDKKKAEDARKKLSMKVINSYNHIYYFTQSGNTWFLTFIDLRKPCEA